MSVQQADPHIALVVEDDPNIRELAAALLEETRLDVVEVESAEAALDCLRERGGELPQAFSVISPGMVRIRHKRAK